MIIGMDKGSTYTKDDGGNIIRSTVRRMREDEVLLEQKTVLEYQGTKWIVGEKGECAADLYKAKHHHTLLLILVMLAKRSPDADLVTGLPIGLYAGQKEEMKRLLDGKCFDVKLNDVPMRIKINHAEVFPEAAGAFYSQSQYQDALVVDIGGLSIDCALFQHKKLIKSSTYALGMMKLYRSIANNLNAKYGLNFDEWDVERVIKDGLYIDGEKVDLNADGLIKEHVQELKKNICYEYDLRAIPTVLLTGGAAEWLHPYLGIKQSCIMDRGQFSNAIGYKNIGRVMFL
jgi:plasmid segregation protein ParM